MHHIEIEYEGKLRTRAVHLQSSQSIATDAPIDNEGKGENFSPTDLAVTALGSCILTIMGIAADQHGFNIRGTRTEITKIMSTNPRKVSKVIIHIYFSLRLNKKYKAILEKSAYSCPVCLSLNPDVVKNIIFHYPNASD